MSVIIQQNTTITVYLYLQTALHAPDDGWRYHPKHVEQFADINKLYIVASCWIIIDTVVVVVVVVAVAAAAVVAAAAY